jgi:hypothetical protein
MRAAAYFFTFSAVALGLWLWLFWEMFRPRKPAGPHFYIDAWGVPIALLIVVLNTMGVLGLKGWPGAAVFNMILVFQSIMLITTGCKQLDLKAATAGCLLLALISLARYTDLFASPYAYRYRRLGHPLMLHYGIEAYFVQQGKGREIENRLGTRNQIQIPLEMQIAVGGNGKAVIKGHRWSPLGIGLQILRTVPANPQLQPGPASAKVALTLANASDAPLALVGLPEACSFSLEPVQFTRENGCRPMIPAIHFSRMIAMCWFCSPERIKSSNLTSPMKGGWSGRKVHLLLKSEPWIGQNGSDWSTAPPPKPTAGA